MAKLESTQTVPSKSRRWLIGVGAVLALSIVVGGAILAFHWPFTSQKVIQALREDWPGKVQAGQFRSTYFPHPGCVLENVTFDRDSTNAGSPALVSIRKATIAANYHDLFFRPGYLSKIVLEGLRIEVPADQPAGQPKHEEPEQASKSSVRLGEVFTRDAVLEIAQKDGDPLKFDIHQLDLQSITDNSPMSYDLSMRNPKPPGEIQSHGKLGPWHRNDLKDIVLSGSYTFDHADLGVFRGIAGILSAKGEFHGTLGQIETQGTTDIPNFEVTRSKHAVPIKTKFTALVDGTTGNTALRSVDASILRTAAHIEGTVSSKPGQHGKTTAINISVRNGHIDDVLRLFVRESKPPMEGTANFHAHVVLPPGKRPFEKKVLWDGDFDIEHAQWEQPSRQANIDTLSKRASGKKNEPTTEKVTAEIKGSVKLIEGVARFQDVSFKVPGAEATMHGDYNLESTKIDFHGDLKTAAGISEDSTGAKAILLKPLDPFFKRKHAGAVVPVEMTGTYANPHFGVVLTGKK